MTTKEKEIKKLKSKMKKLGDKERRRLAMKSHDLTPTDIRRSFLNDSEAILSEIRARMLGTTSPYPASDGRFLQEYWKALVPMIQDASDLEKINADSANAVIKLLSKGKIDTDQALKLMEILQKKQEIEELPRLIQKMDELSRS